MIKLKNGKIIDFDPDPDKMFRDLMSEIIEESYNSLGNNFNISEEETKNLLMKEIMDQSIYVTHQLFEISKLNKELAKFIVTGFLFNSIVLSIPHLKDKLDSKDQDNSNQIIH